MAHRFYVPRNHVLPDTIRFTDNQRNQIKNVLRLRAGDTLRVFDGSGQEYTVVLRPFTTGPVEADIVEVCAPDTESSVRVTLVQSLPKGDRIELILQKCTEIGIAEFLIVESERTVPHIHPSKLPSRLDRWRSIVMEACEQSGRVRLPIVDGVLPLREAVERVRGKCSTFVAWECEDCRMLKSSLPCSSDEIAIFVGPEGGFSEVEVDMVCESGAVPVSLGARILRTETAAIVASALAVYCQ